MSQSTRPVADIPRLTGGVPPTDQPFATRSRLLLAHARRLLRREPVRIRFVREEALVAALVYVAVASSGCAVLVTLAHHRGAGLFEIFHSWDSSWYVRIAQHGYQSRIVTQPDGVLAFSTIAFFPAFPALIRAVHTVSGLPYAYAGAVVSWLAAVVAAVGIHTLVRSIAGHRAAVTCVALWACLPYSFVLWIPYSEALFAAALMWTLVALIARRWVTAGILCAAAGTMRPTASALVGVIVVCAAWAAVRGQDGRRPWAALLIAPTGLVACWLYLGSHVGSLTGWFHAEKAWNQSFDFGQGTVRFLRRVADYSHYDMRFVAVLAVLALSVLGITALCQDRRVPWPLVLLLVAAWVLMVGTPSAPFSKPRFMLPFAPLLLMLPALPLSRASAAVRVLLYGCGAAFTGWYAVGLLLIFRIAP